MAKYKKGGSGTLRTDMCMLGKLWEGPDADRLVCPIGRWYVSEKLDGMRALWDGKGGLWSRYGKRVWAPSWWLERLQGVAGGICLDGELWIGRGVGSFQKLMSICKTQSGARDSDWSSVTYRAFDVLRVVDPSGEVCGGQVVFENKLPRLEGLGEELYHPQELVQGGQSIAPLLDQVVGAGGEGLMLRLAVSTTVVGTGRSGHLLKVKPLVTGTGVVLGVTPGKGKHVGRIGALVVQTETCQFQLSGMTDAEREMSGWIGREVTYKYRELSADGKPREARFVSFV